MSRPIHNLSSLLIKFVSVFFTRVPMIPISCPNVGLPHTLEYWDNLPEVTIQPLANDYVAIICLAHLAVIVE